MNWKTITYWISTGLVSAMMVLSAVMYLSSPQAAEGFRSLGYPGYFRVMLAIAKFFGVLALLSPGVRVLKEWAYAGFTITFIAALVSHAVCGQMDHVMGPVIALVVLGVSYYFRPASRRVAEAPAA